MGKLRRKITDIDEDGVILREFVKDVEDDKDIVWKPREIFLKVYVNELKKIRHKMSTTEMCFCLDMLPYVGYSSGLLTKTGKNDKRFPLKTKDIMAITGYKETLVRDCLGRLVNIKVLARTKVGKEYLYYANPHIFFKGQKINETLISMFKEYKS